MKKLTCGIAGLGMGAVLLVGCEATEEDFLGVYESPALPNGNYATMVVKEDRVVLMSYNALTKRAINPIILETRVEGGKLVLKDQTSEVIYEHGDGDDLVCFKCPKGVPQSFKLVAKSAEEWQKGS